MKAWSISTTLRNPERIPLFAQLLREFEGREWNHETQEDFYVAAIRERVVTPTSNGLSSNWASLLDDLEHPLTHSEARKIFDAKSYFDPPMRGRTQMSPLVDFGLVRCDHLVAITQLGNDLIDGKVPFAEVMLNFVLKFQVPQPGHSKYKAAQGFNIKPFHGTLAVIHAVNQLVSQSGGQPKGLSWDEFCIFIPTLINADQVDKTAQLIVDLRSRMQAAQTPEDRQSIWETSKREFITAKLESRESFDSGKPSDTLYDYGDNAFRYFSQSSFLRLRGNGNYVDLSEPSLPQIEMLINLEGCNARDFSSKREYAEYLEDLDSYAPPWATKDHEEELRKSLVELLNQRGIDPTSLPRATTDLSQRSVLSGSPEIGRLRMALSSDALNRLAQEAMEPGFLAVCADDFRKMARSEPTSFAASMRLKPSAQLEYLAYRAFLSLDDLERIKPNYPTDDEGAPTFTAGGGVPDLEVFYTSFNAIGEVTLLRTRDQWMAESQPVQRHLHDFVVAHADKEALCIFLAPQIHRDSRNSFRSAFLAGFDSLASMKVIPLTFEMFSNFLDYVESQRLSGVKSSHAFFLKWLNSLLPTPSETTDVWWSRISSDVLANVSMMKA